MADSAVSPIPEGYHSLTPSLTVRGAADAIEFYERAFVNDTFWGDRFGGLQDPFGHNWAIATRKENLTEEEVRRRADAFTASMSGGQQG